MIHNPKTKELSIVRLVTFVASLATVVTMICLGIGYAVGTGRVLSKLDTTAKAAERNTNLVDDMGKQQAADHATIAAMLGTLNDIKSGVNDVNHKLDSYIASRR